MDSRPADSTTLSRVPHPGDHQGGDRLVMSSVEIVESPVLYDKPVDGLTAVRGRALVTCSSWISTATSCGTSLWMKRPCRVPARRWRFVPTRGAGAIDVETAVRFAPDLDDRNATPAGEHFIFPVSVQRNGSDGTGRMSAPVAEVSYDDGTTWRHATVKRDHRQWKATVNHLAGAEFVSLRSRVTDTNGNAQRQTIRAYALK
jgi:hypothetical protein